MEPETFLSGEIGYRYALDNLTLSAAYYYTDLRNYIQTVPTGQIVDGLIEVSKQNSASGQIQGVELTGAVQLPAGFDVSGNATWTRGDLTRPIAGGARLTEPISRVQPLTGNIALNWSGRDLGDTVGPLQDVWMTADIRLVDRAGPTERCRSYRHPADPDRRDTWLHFGEFQTGVGPEQKPVPDNQRQ